VTYWQHICGLVGSVGVWPRAKDQQQFLHLYGLAKSMRSSSSQLLFVPCHNLSFDSWAFCVSDPKVWNTLPLHIRELQSLSAFRDAI